MIDPYEHRPGYYWLSFSMPKKSKQPPYGFRGVVIVYGESFDDALNKSWELKLNPGGEVLGSLLNYEPNSKWVNRLLSREDCKNVD